MKRSSWPRLLAWTAAAAVATPLAFAGGMLLVPDEPEQPTKQAALPSRPTATASAASVGRADGAGGVRKVTGKKEVRLASYDPTTGKATLTTAKGGKPAVKTGDVIASDRTAELPHGALVKVTDPKPDRGGAVTVAPATLPDLLGDAKVNSTTPVDQAGITVKPLIKGVSADVSPATKPAPIGTIAPAPLPTGSADGRHAVGGELALDLDIPLAQHGFRGTKQGGPTLSGWVHFQPQVIFAYQRDHALSLAPSEASIGIGGAYDYGWKVHASLPGAVDSGRQPLRLPFAEVHVHTTLFVSGFPIVVDADLTYFYQVSASGQISLDTEQKTTGVVSLGARYTKATGWERLPVATATTTVGKELQVTGSATAKATIGADLKVALYGAVGAGLEWAPYLRADVAAEALPKQRLDWALYAGFDLTGSLFVQLKILGIPIFEKTFPLPPLNVQTRVAGGTLTPPSASPTPAPPARKAA